MKENIYVTKPSLPPLEEYVDYLKEIWESSNLTNMGKLWQEFDARLLSFLQIDHCLPLCNGHMSLEMALQAFELSGEVITTPFTFASTTHAIVRNNLMPVFCDIRESDCTIDVDKIENLITDKTTAIVPVHVYGMPCDVKRIDEIAKKYNLKVIYDAAHAFGEKIEGKGIAGFGDASMFSFHATKCFNSIEGGCVATPDKDTLMRIYQLHNFGIMDEESVCYVGANAKMNEFQAAMGLCNLKYYEDNRRKRKKLFDCYRENLSEVRGVRLLEYDEQNIEYNYSYFPIFISANEYGHNRDDLRDYLLESGIHARKYFYPITSRFDCYSEYNFTGDTTIAERLSKEVITLPLYADLEMCCVENICELIRKYGNL